MEKGTQEDIVAQHLQSLRIGELLTDKLRFPNVEKLFIIDRPEDKPEVRTEHIRLPIAGTVANSTRDEIVRGLVQCLQYSPDITSIGWTVGEDKVEIHREAGTVTSLAEHATEDGLHSLLMIVLRSRASVQGFEWEFGKPFVKVIYKNQQYA
jgi:hypothetical protein